MRDMYLKVTFTNISKLKVSKNVHSSKKITGSGGCHTISFHLRLRESTIQFLLQLGGIQMYWVHLPQTFKLLAATIQFLEEKGTFHAIH